MVSRAAHSHGAQELGITTADALKETISLIFDKVRRACAPHRPRTPYSGDPGHLGAYLLPAIRGDVRWPVVDSPLRAR